jgi:hypothetical protein
VIAKEIKRDGILSSIFIDIIVIGLEGSLDIFLTKGGAK